jgi:hypothetical protein
MRLFSAEGYPRRRDPGDPVGPRSPGGPEVSEGVGSGVHRVQGILGVLS